MRFRPVVSVLLLAAYLPACMSYQATAQPISELATQPKPAEQVRATLVDGSRVVLKSPVVINDTLRGFRPDRNTDLTVIAIPLDQVKQVEVREMDGTKTMFMVVGAVGATALLFAAMSNAMDDLYSLDLGGMVSDAQAARR
jgi:hypothetical protein